MELKCPPRLLVSFNFIIKLAATVNSSCVLPHSVQWEQWPPRPVPGAGHPSAGQPVRLPHSDGSSFLLLLELPGPGDHYESP